MHYTLSAHPDEYQRSVGFETYYTATAVQSQFLKEWWIYNVYKVNSVESYGSCGLLFNLGLSPFLGICAWSVWNFTWSTSIHGI